VYGLGVNDDPQVVENREMLGYSSKKRFRDQRAWTQFTLAGFLLVIDEDD
jgi:hypothetical protein